MHEAVSLFYYENLTGVGDIYGHNERPRFGLSLVTFNSEEGGGME